MDGFFHYALIVLLLALLLIHACPGPSKNKCIEGFDYTKVGKSYVVVYDSTTSLPRRCKEEVKDEK